MKAKRPVAASAGSAIGTAMRKKLWKRPQPSMVAASNSSVGCLRKKIDRISTVKGSALAAWMKMMPSFEPISPASWIIM